MKPGFTLIKKHKQYLLTPLNALLVILLLLTRANAQLASGSTKFLGNVISSTVPASFPTYWNQVTPENAGKWGSVEGTKDVMNWTNLDLVYNYAKSKNYKFKQHTLVWGSQYPTWLTSLSATDQLTQITQWFSALAARYPGIDYIDVVNEPIKTPCPFAAALGGSGTTGWDWVITSFQMARQYFPNAKLFINEYGTENDAAARAQYITIINLLKARGLIDGIGVQAHYFNLNNMDANAMKIALDDYATTGLDIYISEMDIVNSDPSLQKNKYQELFPVIWNHPSVKGVTLWGYIEGQTWVRNSGILTRSLAEKAAMLWFKQFFFNGVGSSLSISSSLQYFGAASASSIINVTANIGWTVSSDQAWLTVSPSSGTNNGSFTITAATNTTTSLRTGNITVTGGGIVKTISVTQGASGSTANIIAKVKGVTGKEKINILANGVIAATYTLTTAYQNYTATGSGTVRVEFFNDNGTTYDAQVDYAFINGVAYQAEAQVINTGVYQNNGCGGSYSELLNCNGYIEFSTPSSLAASRANTALLNQNSITTNNLVISPNPVTRNTYFNIILPASQGINTIRITDMSGKLIKQVTTTGHQKISLSLDVSPGMYFVKYSNGGKNIIEKLVVN